jgi:hypothetical protein
MVSYRIGSRRSGYHKLVRRLIQQAVGVPFGPGCAAVSDWTDLVRRDPVVPRASSDWSQKRAAVVAVGKVSECLDIAIVKKSFCIRGGQ